MPPFLVIPAQAGIQGRGEQAGCGGYGMAMAARPLLAGGLNGGWIPALASLIRHSRENGNPGRSRPCHGGLAFTNGRERAPWRGWAAQRQWGMDSRVPFLVIPAPFLVIPVKTGIQEGHVPVTEVSPLRTDGSARRGAVGLRNASGGWIPACAGMTEGVVPRLGALALGCKVPGFPFSRE